MIDFVLLLRCAMRGHLFAWRYDGASRQTGMDLWTCQCQRCGAVRAVGHTSTLRPPEGIACYDQGATAAEAEQEVDRSLPGRHDGQRRQVSDGTYEAGDDLP